MRLPTLGAKLRHGLSLYAADGSLLDRTEPAPFAEVVSITLSAGDDDPHAIDTTVGTPQHLPALTERLDRAYDVHETLAALRRSGAESRILRDRTMGWRRLRQLVEAARAELLVADPYFGQRDDDWGLLDGLGVPVRVLTCKVTGEPAPVPKSVNARIRPKGTKVLHDRAYVWHEGRFMLGGSPSTLGDAPIAVMALSPAEAQLRATMFEALWHSPHFRELRRR